MGHAGPGNSHLLTGTVGGVDGMEKGAAAAKWQVTVTIIKLGGGGGANFWYTCTQTEHRPTGGCCWGST